MSDSKYIPRVVCSAIRHESGDLILGPRHFDATMHKQLASYYLTTVSWKAAEQGFIDQHGVFLTREDGYAIASRNGQIVRSIGYETNKLYSEHLY
jgi:hypothetical protein